MSRNSTIPRCCACDVVQAMRQAGLDATNGVAANATNAQKHRVLLFGDMRVAGISSIQKFTRVKQILQGMMPYVDFKQLDFLMAHSKGMHSAKAKLGM